ncbi:MAG TPA: hypothetical protein EYN38_07035, partial [Flavobacteriales bacterium]|nr:hypothetical protein [Flavobacteriales bacterium]
MKQIAFFVFLMSSIWDLLPLQAQTIDPLDFIATLQFDGNDLTGQENCFPVSYTFNTFQDGNGIGGNDVEDNLENLVEHAIGNNIYGQSRTHPNPDTTRGPNDQRAAIYFHHVQQANCSVYQYWLYYADNNYLNKHEHDWERYFVYVQNDTPKYLYLSWHSTHNIHPWCLITSYLNHPIIGVDGGSHAMKPQGEDGVEIRYDGLISLNNGTLNSGNGLTIPWVIYSNDSNVINAAAYSQSPSTFSYGDPFYQSNEYSDDHDAPWNRAEWDNPPHAPIVNIGQDVNICSGSSVLLDAGSGFFSYQWSTGANSNPINVNTPGVYSVTVSDFSALCHNYTEDEIVVTGAHTYDETCSALSLFVDTSNQYQTLTTSCAFSSAVAPPGCANYQGGDVWMKATVPASGHLIIETQADEIIDGGIALYTGASCLTLSFIECNDDSGTGLMPMIDKSGLTPGSTVYIRFWEADNDTAGTFELSVRQPRTVATPVFSPGTGTYNSPQDITITCATSGTSIYYTTDGANPTDSTNLYTGTVYINSTKTLMAKAYRTGWAASGIATATYIFNGAVPVADFTVSSQYINPGNCIDFTDLSTNDPSSWIWNFQGATPSTDTVQHPENICYYNAGVFFVSLVVENAFGLDDEIKTSLVNVGSVDVGDINSTE